MDSLSNALPPAASCLALLLALAIDRLWGEPPARWHPVVWMGRFLEAMTRHVAPGEGRPLGATTAFVRGALAWWVGALIAAGLALAVSVAIHGWDWWWQALVLGVLLKPLMAWRMLREEVQAVEAALNLSLKEGRDRLAWLVSRDVITLSESQVRESAIETLAENLNDSVVAPLFWFVVAGLPGAAVYRFANTADAMWGYKGERNGCDWTWAGKWAARADDVLSWLPARITAALLMLAGAAGCWRQLAQQARRTPSPNSGWPMAAMALVLDVQLAKPGVYTLHPPGRSPQTGDTHRAVQLGQRVVLVLAVVSAASWGLLSWLAF